MCTRFLHRGDDIITGFNFEIDLAVWDHQVVLEKDRFFIGILRPDGVRHSYHGIHRRSVRFGAASSHGKANMMCFNYMEKAGAFSRDAKGQYVIDFGKAKEAMNGWAALILQTQGDGNVEFATKYRAENGGITPALQADLDKINGAGIPRDITFIQGADILLGETK